MRRMPSRSTWWPLSGAAYKEVYQGRVEHHHVCSSCSARYFKIFLIKKALVYICVCICNSEMSRSDWSIRFNEVILRDSYWSEEVYSPNCMQHLIIQN